MGIGGQPNGGNHWDGLIDDVRIAQRPFSEAELRALFVGGRPITTEDTYSIVVDEQLVTTAENGVLANDIDTEGDELTVTLNRDVTDGVLDFNPDGSFVYTPDSGFTGTDTFGYIASDGINNSSVTNVQINVGSVGDSIIDVWYGLNQTFGNIGQPQRWVNVLGSVSDSDGISSLSYTLNGGAENLLSLGPDERRLLNDGDFNVDIDRTLLQEGANEVVITVLDSLNSITRSTVTVNYNGGNVWPIPYRADWAQLTAPSDGVQIIDGQWELTPNGIRITEPGYDRLFAVGNIDWSQYELVSTFTVNSVDVTEFAGVGVIGPWSGHTDDPIAGAQPKTGTLPFGAQAWAAYFPPGLQSRIQIGGHQTARDTRDFNYTLGQTYNFRYSVERPNAVGLQHSMKVWAVGTAEPLPWDVQYVDTTSGLTQGSLAFVAHHADVTFGNIVVQPVAAAPPAANDDSYTTNFETVLNVVAADGVLVNDTGGNDTLSAVLEDDVRNGTLELNSDGSFTYTPAQGYFGQDAFSYYVTDGDSDSFTATVSLSVVDPNADSDLLAHLAFNDDQTPTIAADSSIHGNSGVILGPQYVSETSDGSARSLEFKGSDSVSLGGLDVDGTGITLAAWIKADSFPGDNRDSRIITKADGVVTNRHVFSLSTARRGNTRDTVIRGRVRIGGVTRTFRASQGNLETGTWYHVAMTYDESEIKLYVDGVEVAAAVFEEGGPVDQDDTVDVAIGSLPGGGFHWDGRIDDARIAQRALSAVEIQALAALDTGGNYVPVSNDDSYAVITDQQLVVSESAGVLANDSDGDNEPLSVCLLYTSDAADE